MCNTKSSPAARARGPRKDGGSGITVNQSNAKIAPVEIIESEFPTRLTRFELIQDSGGAGEFRGGLGLRREYLNLADARFSIRSMKHTIPPHGANGGKDGRTGDIWINPDNASRQAAAHALCRLSAEGRRYLPARYAGRRRFRRSAGARSGTGAGRRGAGLMFRWKPPSATMAS